MSGTEESRATSLLAAQYLAALGVVTSCCPACGEAPGPLSAITWPSQGWCENNDCAALVWAPQVPAQEQLDRGQEIEL